MNNEVTARLYQASPSGFRILLENETISVQEWLDDTAVTVGTRRNRRNWIRNYQEANGDRPAQEIVDDIKAGKIKPYQTARKFVDYLRANECTPATISQMRSTFVSFLESTVGEGAHSKRTFDRIVPPGDSYVTTVKKSPTPDELRQMLRLSDLRDKALIGGLACMGPRIGEWVSRKRGDVEFRAHGHARVRFQAGQTKARTARYAFLTKEAADWVKQYWLQAEAWAKDSQWVFPGELDGHLSMDAGAYRIKRLFKMAGCVAGEGETYSPHSFRTFADAQMAKCGLDRKYIAAIVGHKSKLAAESHYLDWNEAENRWLETCADKMTWLIEKIEVIKEVHDVQMRKLFALLVKEISDAETFDDIGDISGLLENSRKLLEDKSDSDSASKPAHQP